MRVFISHSSKNSDIAEKLCGKLEEKGFPCFLAPRDIHSGCEYAEEIINGIDNSDVIVLLLSEASNSSPHVLREIERAVSKKKPIIVYKLEEVSLSKSLEYFLMTHQWINAKPGKDYDEIVSRVSEYAEQHDGNPQPRENQENTSPSEKPKRRAILLSVFAAAVVLTAAAVIITVSLSKKPDSQSDLISNSKESSADSGSSQQISDDDSQPESDAPSTTPPAEAADSTEPTTASSPTESKPAEEVILPVNDEKQSAPEQQSEVQQSASQTEVQQPAAAPAELGDTITLGTYNGEPIEWRVIHISEDKTQAVVISDDVLTMKAFDAAEGGSFNQYGGEDYWRTRSAELDPEIQRQIRGDNRWELSNIRTWLNSDKENIKYEGQAPVSAAMSEKRNGYHTEAGFLNGFTDEELSAVAVTEVSTAGNVTEDKVFLLSLDELQWLYDADVSVYAAPTEAAVEQDKSEWYAVDKSAYNTEDIYWWLREPSSDNACECLCVNLSVYEQLTASQYVGLEGFGVRPAMTVDLTSDAVISSLEN